jgi:3-oxoacyl-[acyl-carrier protein] reductase
MTLRFDFSSKKVLITGGSKGIGRAIAEKFVESGAKVAVCARGSKDLEDITESLGVLALQADASKEEEIKTVVARTVEVLGGLDILVNNVGGAIRFGDLWNINAQNWRDAFELNVLSMVQFSKEAIPYLKQSTSPRIINISSISGIEPGFYNPHYTTTKASTINFSKYLSNILAAENILVNCVCPGSVETDSWQKSLEQISRERALTVEEVLKELKPQEAKKIPLGRMGLGDDISPLVLFLASEEANWITGSCFHVNGGKMRAMC